jgi:hypothetical protein
MKLATAAVVLVFLCLLLGGTMVAQAQTSAVGVSQWDVLEYDISTNWNSPANATAPSGYANETTTVTVTITGVSGTTIASQVTVRYLNGTESTSDSSCDVETGENSGSGPPFVAANLGKNDLVNPSAAEAWYINETGTRTYKDSTRETNHLRFEYAETAEGVGNYIISYDYWFDKSTGVVVESTTEVSYVDATCSIQTELKSTTLWLVGDSLSEKATINAGGTKMNVPAVATIITVVIIIVAVAVFVRKRKRKDANSDN